MSSDNFLVGLWKVFVTSAFGSDELQSYSAEYTWSANQMAHAMMGFFLAVVWYWMSSWKASWKNKPWVRYAPPYAVPTIKVAADALVVWGSTYTFPIHWPEFFADKATDLNFWFVGMFLGAAYWTSLRFPWVSAAGKLRRWTVFALAIAIVLVWAGLILVIGRYWVDQKRTFDRSNLPPGWIRVCQFNPGDLFPAEGESAEEQRQAQAEMDQNTRTYLTFIQDAKPRHAVHCVVRGGWPVNRSDLAIAFGTEFAARKRAIYYFTASKLVENPDELNRWKTLANPNATSGEPGAEHPLSPRCVIVDDLASVFPRPSKLKDRTPRDPNLPYDPKARIQDIFDWSHDRREQTSTVWVLTCNEPEAMEWLRYIREYAGGEDRVIDINLGNPHAKRAIFK